MKRIDSYVLPLVAAVVLAACTNNPIGTMGGGMTGVFDRGDTIVVSTEHKPNPNAPLTKYAATMRLGKFADERKLGNPRKIGSGGGQVAGLTQDEVILSRDVADVVAGVLRNRLDDAGYRVLEGAEAQQALFEVSAVIKELTYNVKARDEIAIAIETTIREVSTGKVVWSGVVTEKDERFAGVSGNNRTDVANYLKLKLWLVTGKTVEALSGSLMAARPELFNLTPGSKPVAGVTVLVAPTASAPVPVAAPVVAPQSGIGVATPSAPAYIPRASATSGLLAVNTNPPRAKVYLDGVYYGLSPLRAEVEPGVHAISVKLEGYRMATDKVSVRKGDTTEMELSLER